MKKDFHLISSLILSTISCLLQMSVALFLWLFKTVIHFPTESPRVRRKRLLCPKEWSLSCETGSRALMKKTLWREINVSRKADRQTISLFSLLLFISNRLSANHFAGKKYLYVVSDSRRQCRSFIVICVYLALYHSYSSPQKGNQNQKRPASLIIMSLLVSVIWRADGLRDLFVVEIQECQNKATLLK